jgi:hypothetical protein
MRRGLISPAKLENVSRIIYRCEMKTFTLTLGLLLTLATGGCSWGNHTTATTAKPAAAKPAPIVTPDYSLTAKVISVNTVGRFVILSFPAGMMPKIDQTLFLYRNSLKVAELRVTGPQDVGNNHIVADITSGEAQVGDTVSEK